MDYFTEQLDLVKKQIKVAIFVVTVQLCIKYYSEYIICLLDDKIFYFNIILWIYHSCFDFCCMHVGDGISEKSSRQTCQALL